MLFEHGGMGPTLVQRVSATYLVVKGRRFWRSTGFEITWTAKGTHDVAPASQRKDRQYGPAYIEPWGPHQTARLERRQLERQLRQAFLAVQDRVVQLIGAHSLVPREISEADEPEARRLLRLLQECVP